MAFDLTNPTDKTFQRSLAIVIGINDYREDKGIPQLHTASHDATRLARLLLTQLEQDNYNVLLYAGEAETDELCKALDETVRARLTVNGAATLDALCELLTETLPHEVQQRQTDRILFYFAGHGVALESDQEQGPVGYLIPQDATQNDLSSFLPMKEFIDALSKLEQCRHLLLILDCCFAGAIRWSVMRDLPGHPRQISEARYQMFIESPAWQAITSAAHDQKALDQYVGPDMALGLRSGNEEPGKHSPFALALFEALEGQADRYPPSDENRSQAGDGLLTTTELYQYLYEPVYKAGSGQGGTPQRVGLWPLPNHHSGEFVFQLRHELWLATSEDLTYKHNPYRGLETFNEEHADLFFGRQAAVETLTQYVQDNRLTVVLGASGTGKSSLVKAGLIPHLRQQNGVATVVTIRPAEHPLVRLESALRQLKPAASVAPNPPDASPQQPPFALLVIDQFEELVTLCQDKNQRRQVYRRLESLVKSSDNIRLVFTVRSDFEPRFAHLTLFSGMWSKRYVVQPMSRQDLRQVIENPAAARSLYFKPYSLVDEILDDVAQMPGALPLLSFTMSGLYRRYIKRQAESSVKDRALTQEDYHQLGRVIGALGTQADAIFRQLGTEGQHHRAIFEQVWSQVQKGETIQDSLIGTNGDETRRIETVLTMMEEAGLVTITEDQIQPANVAEQEKLARKVRAQVSREGARHLDTLCRVILRMLSLEGGRLARRRVPWDEEALFQSIGDGPTIRNELRYTDPNENRRVKRIVDLMTAERLLVVDQGSDGNTLEPAHDALINSWSKIEQWKTDESDARILLQRRVTNAVRDWITPTNGEADEPQRRLVVLQTVIDKLTVNDSIGPADKLWHNSVFLPQLEEELEGERTENVPSGLRWIHTLRNYLWPRRLTPTHPFWLNALEMTFIQKSSVKQRLNRLFVALFLVVVFAGLSGLTLFAINRQIAAQNDRDRATARALLAEGDAAFEEHPMLGLRLAMEAWYLVPGTPGDEITCQSTPTDANDDAALRCEILASIRGKMQEGRLLKLGNNVEHISYVPDSSSLFVVDRFDTHGDLFIVNSDEAITFPLSEAIHNTIAISGSDYLIVDYDRETTSELYRLAPSGPVSVSLAGDVSEVTIIPGSNYFVADFWRANGVLYRANPSGLASYPLAGEIFNVQFLPSKDYFIMRYWEVNGELYHLTPSGLVSTPLAGEVAWVTPIPDSNYIEVNYKRNTPELYRLTPSGPLSTSLSSSLRGVIPILNSNYLVIDYGDGNDALYQLTPDGHVLSSLAGDVYTVTSIPDSNYHVVHYEQGNSELYRLTPNGIVSSSLAGPVHRVIPLPDTDCFVVVYKGQTATELYQLVSGWPISSSLPIDVIDVTPIPNSDYFVAHRRNPAHYVQGPSALFQLTSRGLISAPLSGAVEYVTPIPESEYVIVHYSEIDYTRAVTSELVQLTPAGPISTSLSGNVERVMSIPESDYFIVDYTGAVTGELYQFTSQGTVSTSLSGEVNNVTLIPDSNYFVVEYASSITGELYHLTSNEDPIPIPLSGDFFEVMSIPNSDYFVVDYVGLIPIPGENYFTMDYTRDVASELYQLTPAGLVSSSLEVKESYETASLIADTSNLVFSYPRPRPSELWTGEGPLRRLLTFKLGLTPQADQDGWMAVDSNKFIAKYDDGTAYLLDLAWLAAMTERGDVTGLPVLNLLDIACQPYGTGFFDEDDKKNLLTEFLEPLGILAWQACQSQESQSQTFFERTWRWFSSSDN